MTVSPLEQIQQAEADIATRIHAARESTKNQILEAKKEAEQIKLEAIQIGRHEGEGDAQEIIKGAKKESGQMLRQSCDEIENLHRKLGQSAHLLVEQATAFILEKREEI